MGLMGDLGSESGDFVVKLNFQMYVAGEIGDGLKIHVWYCGLACICFGCIGCI